MDDAVALVRRQQESEFRFDGGLLESRMSALDEAERRYRERLDRVVFLTRQALRAGRPAWYGGPDPDATNWPRLRERLVQQGRSAEEIRLVDEESTAVLSLLDNPGMASFSTRGLVIGHVQSGKTGNMAALLAKAADTPYRFFVVLSGMTDALRNQTQRRLEADVVDTGDEGRWHLWTRANTISPDGSLVNGDFSETDVSGFAFGHHNHLAVIKKNAGILRRFLRKLRATPRAELEKIPFIVIDDECDQASVNSARLETAITTINRLIRQMLASLPRVAYIGYTATPFANVLINPQDAGDLYPRHFIHPLKRPNAYFGAAELFGRHALDGDADETESGYDMIRIVPDIEAPMLRPQSRSSAFDFQVSPSLQDAIHYFIMVMAAKHERGQGDSHSSMLVHTSMLNSVHQAAETAIRPWLAALAARLHSEEPALISQFRDLWQQETARATAGEFGLEPVPFERIAGQLAPLAAEIEVKVENWRSTDRIDYDQPRRRYLVIGGNVLARGLTLEGLVVSFFMRTPSQYDTLMQMGRWFGYRPGIEDLPRVWMEDEVRDYFFDLATVEEEIRRDAGRYATDQVTPEEFAVRIRRIPGLAVTARAKMRHARVAQIGYSGQHLQTIRFRRHDASWLAGNWNAAATLLREGSPPEMRGPNHLVRRVPVAAVKRFLEEYRFLDSGRGLDSGHLVRYIGRQEEAGSTLDRWNIVVIGTSGTNLSEMPLGPLGQVSCVMRSPLRHSGEIACIKALMSRRDIVADLDIESEGAVGSWEALKRLREARRAPPLLLMYPIFRDSRPSAKRTDREDMSAVADLLGIGLVFPGSPDGDIYVEANLQPLDADSSMDEGEDAIPAEIVDDARS